MPKPSYMKTSGSCLRLSCDTRFSRWSTGPDGHRTLCRLCHLQYCAQRLTIYQHPASSRCSVNPFPGARPVRVKGWSRLSWTSPKHWRSKRHRNLAEPIVEPLSDECDVGMFGKRRSSSGGDAPHSGKFELSVKRPRARTSGTITPSDSEGADTPQSPAPLKEGGPSLSSDDDDGCMDRPPSRGSMGMRGVFDRNESNSQASPAPGSVAERVGEIIGPVYQARKMRGTHGVAETMSLEKRGLASERRKRFRQHREVWSGEDQRTEQTASGLGKVQPFRLKRDMVKERSLRVGVRKTGCGPHDLSSSVEVSRDDVMSRNLRPNSEINGDVPRRVAAERQPKGGARLVKKREPKWIVSEESELEECKASPAAFATKRKRVGYPRAVKHLQDTEKKICAERDSEKTTDVKPHSVGRTVVAGVAVRNAPSEGGGLEDEGSFEQAGARTRGPYISVKAEYAGSLRRLRIPVGMPLFAFRKELRDGFELDTPFVVKYQDEESDFVTVASDRDMKELFILAKEYELNPLRVQVLARPVKLETEAQPIVID